jgi:hypothetical protein
VGNISHYCFLLYCLYNNMVEYWWFLKMFIVRAAGLMISKFLRQSIGCIMLNLFV